MNRGTRNNLRVRIGDVVHVSALTELPNATRIQVLPFADTIEGITGNITQTFIVPYFKDAFRPVTKGDFFQVKGTMNKPVEFKIVAVEPGEYGTVTDKTLVFDEGEPIQREAEEQLDGPGYDDIGGCDKQMAKIREMVELPLRHP